MDGTAASEYVTVICGAVPTAQTNMTDRDRDRVLPLDHGDGHHRREHERSGGATTNRCQHRVTASGQCDRDRSRVGAVRRLFLIFRTIDGSDGGNATLPLTAPYRHVAQNTNVFHLRIATTASAGQ